MAPRKKKLTPDEAREYSLSLGKAATGNYEMMDFAIHTLDVPGSLEMSTAEWVESIGGYVKLSVEQRQEAVAALLAEGKGLAEVGRILGLSESTVRRDGRVVEAAKKAAQKALPQGSQEAPEKGKKPSSRKAPPVAEQRPEIREMIDAGKTDAEIAFVLDRGVATIEKERAAYRKEKEKEMQADLQKRRATIAKPIMSDEEASAMISDVADRMRKALGDSTYSEFLSIELEEILDLTKRLVASGTEITDFERVLGFWGAIGNELWVYGAKKGLDVSAIADAINHMKGDEA